MKPDPQPRGMDVLPAATGERVELTRGERDAVYFVKAVCEESDARARSRGWRATLINREKQWTANGTRSFDSGEHHSSVRD